MGVRRWAAAALVAVAAGSATAQVQVAPAPQPVAVGDRAPDFTLAASDGTARRLADLAGKRALVLVFFRGVW